MATKLKEIDVRFWDITAGFVEKPIAAQSIPECTIHDCPLKTECANHMSAGDFRTEDGGTPVLSYVNNKWYCEQRFSSSSMGAYLYTENIVRKKVYVLYSQNPVMDLPIHGVYYSRESAESAKNEEEKASEFDMYFIHEAEVID